jgi:hypothetical protein
MSKLQTTEAPAKVLRTTRRSSLHDRKQAIFRDSWRVALRRDRLSATFARASTVYQQAAVASAKAFTHPRSGPAVRSMALNAICKVARDLWARAETRSNPSMRLPSPGGRRPPAHVYAASPEHDVQCGSRPPGVGRDETERELVASLCPDLAMRRHCVYDGLQSMCAAVAAVAAMAGETMNGRLKPELQNAESARSCGVRSTAVPRHGVASERSRQAVPDHDCSAAAATTWD